MRSLLRRARWWQVVALGTVAAFAAGFAVTAVTIGGGGPAGARPVASAAQVEAKRGTGVVDPSVRPFLNPSLLQAVPVGPGSVSKLVRGVLTSAGLTSTLDTNGIPAVALQAYQHAADVLATSDRSCQLPWELLAGIGRVESDHGRFGGSELLPNGDTTKHIYGIPLDGRPGVALIRDTDHGRLDGDPNFDRAVGPMQFIPSTWASFGADGNGDGKKDPNNIFDAALAAGDYLCAGGGNLSNQAQAAAAVRRYNDADSYVRVVLALAASYARGGAATIPETVPAGSGSSGGSVAPPAQSAPEAPAPQAPAAPKAPAPQPAAPKNPPAPAAPRARPTTPALPAPTTPAAPTASATPTAPAAPSTPTAPALPRLRPGQTANIGWAPAMRQVVVSILTGPKATPSAPSSPSPSPAPSPSPSPSASLSASVSRRASARQFA